MSDDPRLLRDEITLLAQSIDDARAEHDAGDLDDAALATIVERDSARLALARERLAAIVTAPTPSRDPVLEAPRRRRGWLLAVSATCVVVALVVGVIAAADPFASTPSPPRITNAIKLLGLLDAGERAVADNEPLRALTAYDAALHLDPHDAEALVESGWLRYEQGLAEHRASWVRAGAASLRHAVVVAPNDAAAHLYDGIVLDQYDKDRDAARHQLLRAGDLPESQVEQSITATLLALLDPKR
jgi:hypothetical protein